MDIESQQVWRTLSGSSTSSSGYFVWSVVEVVGEPLNEKLFEKCRDGSFVMIWCDHFWTRDRAVGYLMDKAEWERLHIIA